MKRQVVAGLLLALAAVGADVAVAQEHNFGLRTGSFQLPESEVLTDSHFVLRDNFELFFSRDLDSAEYSGSFVEGFYEWRRDTDAHFSLAVSGGVFARDATHVETGLVEVPETRGGDTAPDTRLLSSPVTSTLEYTLYFVHVSPRYNFTTGKVRAWVGGGAGLWANFWREVVDVEYTDIFSCDPGVPPDFALNNCTSTLQFRESEGDRRTILPISVSAGLTVQFLPHWSFYLEDRFLFGGDSSLTLFRDDSEFSMGGNQVILGFSYRL